jgi:DNA-binding response OmpR family regulator
MTTPKKLLIIDDDPDYVSGIKGILETANYQVETAYNPKDGFAALLSKHYDLLLLDIMMGRGAEGVALARKIRKEPKLSDLPVLIITGLREQIAFLFPGQPVHPRFVETDELLEKPVEPKLLLDKVSALLQTAEQKKAQPAKAKR